MLMLNLLRMSAKLLLALILIIAFFNVVPVSADEKEQDPEEKEELTFKEAVGDFAKNMRTVRKYIIEQAKKRKLDEKYIRLLAEVIYWENWWTDKLKKAAYYTGAVVMNRVNSPHWPDNVYDVIYETGQYSTTKYFYTEDIPEECYEMARDIYYNGTPDVPSNVVYQATFIQGSGLWGDKINGECFCYE